VEFVAPGDYMVRPPQPPAYVFVLDVSVHAIQAGALAAAAAAIKASLDDMPGSPRTLIGKLSIPITLHFNNIRFIGFITFDSAIHFYNLKSSLSSPQMLVVSDIADPLTPLPEDLLVNLMESRSVGQNHTFSLTLSTLLQVVDTLLDSLPSMFGNSANPHACLGPALMAAKRVIEHIGGKVQFRFLNIFITS
jgi:protein transport protein SEC24